MGHDIRLGIRQPRVHLRSERSLTICVSGGLGQAKLDLNNSGHRPWWAFQQSDSLACAENFKSSIRTNNLQVVVHSVRYWPACVIEERVDHFHMWCSRPHNIELQYHDCTSAHVRLLDMHVHRWEIAHFKCFNGCNIAFIDEFAELLASLTVQYFLGRVIVAYIYATFQDQHSLDDANRSRLKVKGLSL